MSARLLAVAFLALSATGCSPKSVGGSDAGADQEKACADSAYARCSRVQACSSIAIQLRYGDMATCQANMKAYCVAGFNAPSTGGTPASLEACVAAIPNWDCADYLFSTNPPPECVQTTGSIANGGACAYPGQCQSGFCAVAPGANCGTCAPAPSPGDTCTQLVTCGMGLICDVVTGTCEPPAAAGSSCLPGQSCVPGQECVGANYTTGAPGNCQVAVEVDGGACSGTTAYCDFYGGLVCNTTAKTCVPLTLAGGGQPCGYVPSLGVTEYCAQGEHCPNVTDGGQAVCPGTAAMGAACDVVNGPGCVPPARCIATGGGTAGTCGVADATACH